MRKLNTIQKNNKLNEVYAVGEQHMGVNYEYNIYREYEEGEYILDTISFQRGARNLEDSTEGVVHEDLLEIVRDRLAGFQNTEFKTRENAIALTHIEEALLWLNKRIEDRASRGVLGTYEK